MHEPLYIVACGPFPENVDCPTSGLTHMGTERVPQLVQTSKEVLAIERWAACIREVMARGCGLGRVLSTVPNVLCSRSLLSHYI